MPGVSEAFQGDGLLRLQRVLGKFEADPLELDRARILPPPALSPAGTTTRSASPDGLSEEQRRREEQHYKEHGASVPRKQFVAQRDEEMRRIWNEDPRSSWMSRIPIKGSHEKIASETVKKRWVEQGIWMSKWDEMVDGRFKIIGRWKHEEPLELESESESDADAESPPRSFSILGIPQKQPKPRRPKNDEEKQRIKERLVLQEHNREASRPYHQFVYQISKARERIQEESAHKEGVDATINTRAYENVKDTWIKRGIWDERWGKLPGMSWKHEEPVEKGIVRDPVPVLANPTRNGGQEAGEARIGGRSVTNILESSTLVTSPPSAESDHNQESRDVNTSQHGPSVDIDLAGLENDDAKRSPSAPISPRPRTSKRILGLTARQALRPSKKDSSHKGRQPAGTSLGPTHSSKVSKAARKKKAGPQRRPNVSKVSNRRFSDVEKAEEQPRPGPRKRRGSLPLQPPLSNSAKDSKRITRSQSKQAMAENSAAKLIKM